MPRSTRTILKWWLEKTVRKWSLFVVVFLRNTARNSNFEFASKTISMRLERQVRTTWLTAELKLECVQNQSMFTCRPLILSMSDHPHVTQTNTVYQHFLSPPPCWLLLYFFIYLIELTGRPLTSFQHLFPGGSDLLLRRSGYTPSRCCATYRLVNP